MRLLSDDSTLRSGRVVEGAPNGVARGLSSIFAGARHAIWWGVWSITNLSKLVGVRASETVRVRLGVGVGV